MVIKQLMRPGSPMMQLSDYLVIATVQYRRNLHVLRLILGIMLVSHMLACVLGISAIMADEKIDTFWGTHGYCWPNDLYQLTPQDPWKSKCVDAWDQYTFCYQIAVGQCFKMPWQPFTTKRGPGIPKFSDDSNALFTETERMLFFVVTFCGAIIQLYLAGSFVALVTVRGGRTVAETVTLFCKKHKMSFRVHRQLQEYFYQLNELSEVVPNPALFHKLSPTLATKLVHDMHGTWLGQLPFVPDVLVKLQTISARNNLNTLLTKVCLAMKPGLFIAKEFPQAGRMYVIVKGVAVSLALKKVYRTMDSWGAYSIILTKTKKSRLVTSQGHVKALSNLQILAMDSDDFVKLEREFPELHPSFLKIRVWALRRLLFWGAQRAAILERSKTQPELDPAAAALRVRRRSSAAPDSASSWQSSLLSA